MIGEISITVIKYVALSALLLSIYALLLKGRVSYLAQRIFMLSIPVVALLVSVLSVDMIHVDRYPTVSHIVEMIDLDETVAEASEVSRVEPMDMDYSVVVDDYVTTPSLDPLWIALALWLVVAIYLLSRYLGGVLYIRHLRTLSTGDRHDNLWIYRCVLVSTPFSFFRSIYLDNQLSGEKLDIVLRHESAHISRGHYIDKLLVELYLILSWFNPVVWRLRRELCSVHEFEADRVVLGGYGDINSYRKFLFDEVDLSSPRVANGFNSSLIKQRFLEMKKSYENQHSGLRKALALLSVVTLVSLTSLTYVSGTAAEAELEVMTEVDPQPQELRIVGASTKQKEVEEISEDKITVEMESGEVRVFSGAEIESSEFRNINKDSISSISVKKATIPEPRLDTQRYLDNVKVYPYLDVKEPIDPDLAFEADKKRNNHEYYNYYFMSKDQYQIIPYDRKMPHRISVYRRDGYTEVESIFRIVGAWHWVHFSSNSYLIDPNSGDKYKIHSMESGIPLDRTSVIRGLKGRYVAVKSIYPPLKPGVKKVDFVEWTTSGVRVPKNGSPWNVKGVKVQSEKTKSYGDQVEGNVITLDSDFEL